MDKETIDICLMQKRQYVVPCYPCCLETLALLSEVANRNAVGASSLAPHARRGRGRGLGSFLLLWGRGPLHAHPQLEPSTVGKGRARRRNPGPHLHPDLPLCVPISRPQCLCPHGDIPSPLPPDVSSRPISLKSITSSKAPESCYEADSD